MSCAPPYQQPSWNIAQWLNLPKGQKNLDVGDCKGRVLYLYCFQSWCPGCHEYGFPTLRKQGRIAVDLDWS